LPRSSHAQSIHGLRMNTLSPFRVIFLLLRPCLCLLLACVLTSWAYVPCISSKFLRNLALHNFVRFP
jgi:hypothetical protein